MDNNSRITTLKTMRMLMMKPKIVNWTLIHGHRRLYQCTCQFDAAVVKITRPYNHLRKF